MKKDKSIYFKLYACCIPVKGATRSIVCDIQKEDFCFISNGLYDILINLKNKSLYEIKKEYNFNYNEIIDEYFNYLEEKECGFWCEKSELKLFPDIDFTYEEPYEITNAIVDSNKNSNHNYKRIFNELEEVSCLNVQLRFYDEISPDFLIDILKLLDRKRIISIEIILPFSENFLLFDIVSFTKNYPRITLFCFTSSNTNTILKEESCTIINTTQKIDSCMHCGLISTKYFSINTKTFCEAKKYNTCLHRKIAIDVEGKIKNCPSCRQDFGKISNNNLKQIVSIKEFKEYWYITKDQIHVCQDCEFRYMCTDCRAYLSNELDIYSKPLKCNYDPYSAKFI